ncbi:hypothetical protein ACFWAY_42120 [Rhodococcus sp. NPDC059968]|uniref:hypothetical protein n=1 Tax=Rhodococcus sp. NPDC059968 TaxID=3347017 RepID=UPI00366BEE4A
MSCRRYRPSLLSRHYRRTALPPLPPNPVEALLQGHGLPGLPGVDELFKPLTNLAGSFGTGTFGSFDPTSPFDPTSLLDMSSGIIDQAMSMSVSGCAWRH